MEEERLEQIHQRAGAGYGAALRDHIGGAAAGPTDLWVQVQADLETLRGPGEDPYEAGVAGQLAAGC